MRRLTVALLVMALGHPGFAQPAGFPIKRWFAVETLNGIDVRANGLTFFADSVADGGGPTAHGFAGCNTWRARPDIRDPDQIRLGEIATTKKFCQEGDTMGIEGDYVRALSKVARWRLDGDALLLTGEETTLRLSPQPQP